MSCPWCSFSHRPSGGWESSCLKPSPTLQYPEYSVSSFSSCLSLCLSLLRILTGLDFESGFDYLRKLSWCLTAEHDVFNHNHSYKNCDSLNTYCELAPWWSLYRNQLSQFLSLLNEAGDGSSQGLPAQGHLSLQAGEARGKCFTCFLSLCEDSSQLL